MSCLVPKSGVRRFGEGKGCGCHATKTQFGDRVCKVSEAMGSGSFHFGENGEMGEDIKKWLMLSTVMGCCWLGF